MRFVKMIGISLVVIFLVIVGALALVLYFVSDSEKVRTGIENQLRTISGKNVKIGHIKLSPGLPKILSLRVEGISVTNPDGSDLISAEAIHFVPSWGPLFSGNISVDSIRIKNLRSTITRQKDG